MKKTLRIITQLAFLALFALLFAKGRIQLWLAVCGSGAILSLVFSRFYCGWIYIVDADQGVFDDGQQGI